MYGFPFAPIQILTGDTRRSCSFSQNRLPDDCRLFQKKSRIDRRFESRSQDEVVSLKHGRLAHVRSQFSLFRRSPTHKNFFCTCLSSLSAKIPIFTNQKLFFRTNLSLLPSKAPLFHPPLPISTPLNLLFAKNTAVLLLFALILCCKAGSSHRFKSLPAIPSEVTVFRKTGYLMMAAYFSENHVSTGDLNRGRRTESRVLFGYFLHDAKSDNPYSLVGSSEVFQTSKQHAKAPTSHRNN